jgi:hypothetical protein
MRAGQLTAQALAPGSPLACLEGMAGENVEAACEKALFAGPAIVAAASSYIAARLNLLSDVAAYARNGGNLDPILLPLRRSLEADRFGFVAHILAMRDGCTSGRCTALTLLRDPERVRANLSAQTFDRYIAHYLTTWAQPDVPVADAAPPATGALAAGQSAGPSQPSQPSQKKVVLDADFPSAASIPAVSIMNAEPRASTAGGAADRGAASRRSSRKRAGNAPAQASTSSVDPVWAPGTAPNPQPLSPQASPPPQASAGDAPAAQ